jgi:hypothetical protein
MVDDGGDRSGRDTWARRAGLRRVHVLAANGSEAGCGHGGSRRLQRREGNVEGTVRARVLSSHACPERRGGEALQRQPHMTGEMGRRGGGGLGGGLHLAQQSRAHTFCRPKRGGQWWRWADVALRILFGR